MKSMKAQGWKKPPKVLNIVNNVDLLKQTEGTFRREMRLTGDFSRIFEDENGNIPPLIPTPGSRAPLRKAS